MTDLQRVSLTMYAVFTLIALGCVGIGYLLYLDSTAQCPSGTYYVKAIDLCVRGARPRF